MNPIAYEDLNRKIFINGPDKNLLFKYPTNMIKTRKYTVYTFLPKALYLQFLRIANIYFLFIAIISSFEIFSPISPITSVIPLVLVLGTSIIREALEDWSRFKNDRVTNNQKTLIHKYQKTRGTEYAEKHWEDIHIGDIIKIENNEEIPADVVLLTSSDESGIAYVETANLDGEKNLKLKQSKSEIHELIKSVGIDYITGAMLVDAPNGKIHKFRGVIELESLDTLYLGYNNLLLRGTFLKNTTYALGLVVYTGHDTKLLRNQGTTRNKKSHLEKKLNWYIVFVFFIQLMMCLLLTLLALIFRSDYLDTEADYTGPKLSYLFPDEVNGKGNGATTDGLITFASFLLLLNTMIPISLVVSLEVAKLLQTFSFDLDQLMWTDDQRSKVLNMLIHEDLAKVEYIFADKTGTLTSNEMRFITCSVNGVVYTKEELMDLRENSIVVNNIEDGDKEAEAENDKDKEKEDSFSLFWLALVLCHEVIIDQRKEDSLDFREKYQGSSPDEVELVSFAAELNYVFEAKRNELYVLKFKGVKREFRLLSKIDFNSDRKRMSVIMRETKTGKLYLFCKGADNIMMKRLKGDTPMYIQEKTKDDLHSFSMDGLRTLVIAYKELDEKTYLEWNDKYYNAQMGGFNVLCEEDPVEKIKALEDEIEIGMELLGATGLEDKLQEGVGETIIDLHKAGIKIWMLTGDKLETAENIGHATNLIAKDTKSFKIRTHDVDSTLKRFQRIKEKMRAIVQGQVIPADCSNIIGGPDQIELEPIPPQQDEYDSGEEEEQVAYKSFALIIDGDAINYTFHNEDLKKIFLDLIPQFRTVICCRSTPSQKADVVTFVKSNLKKMTLAIGDGGNDVNMIQKADIGVGIFGKEGHQAAYASDYAFARFYFLWRLLLVHGRWAYIRTANFINFFLYKNLIFTLPQFWFALYSGYSGQSIYDNAYITNYNTVFTSVAPVYYAAQERDIDPRESENIREALPYVYAEYRRKELFSPKKFAYWWFFGFAHSAIIFYTIINSFNDIVDIEGKTFDLWRDSVISICGVFFSVFSLFVIETSRFDCIAFLCYIVFTLFAFFPVGALIMDVISSEVDNVLRDVLRTPKYWAVIFFITLANALLIYIPKLFMSFFYPDLVDLLKVDRNKRWKMQSNPKVTAKSEDTISYTEKKFDFNAHIMIKGWYTNGQ